MYKVAIEFHSNIKGVYTREEETATDKQQANFKLERMIDRWFNILCPHIDLDKLNIRDENNFNVIHKMDSENKRLVKQIFIRETLKINDKLDHTFIHKFTEKENIQERSFKFWLEEMKPEFQGRKF
jgi:hypothetical protein